MQSRSMQKRGVSEKEEKKNIPGGGEITHEDLEVRHRVYQRMESSSAWAVAQESGEENTETNCTSTEGLDLKGPYGVI